MLIGLVAGCSLVLVGAVIWGTTLAAANDRLRRNRVVGIRTGATGASDAAWLAGHRAALALARVTGIVGVVIGLAMIVDGIVTRNDEGSVLFWALFVVGYGGVMLSTVLMVSRANRAARGAAS